MYRDGDETGHTCHLRSPTIIDGDGDSHGDGDGDGEDCTYRAFSGRLTKLPKRGVF